MPKSPTSAVESAESPRKFVDARTTVQDNRIAAARRRGLFHPCFTPIERSLMTLKISVSAAFLALLVSPAFGGHAATVVNGTTNEIFTAMGSAVMNGSSPFLKVIALGPGNGGPSSSTIQWLGAYNGNGRIAQNVGNSSQNFDIYAGTATQSVPEPTSAVLMIGAIILLFATGGRRQLRAQVA